MEGGGDQGGAYRLYANQGRQRSDIDGETVPGKPPMACGRHEEMPKGYWVDNSVEVRGWHNASSVAGTRMQG